MWEGPIFWPKDWIEDVAFLSTINGTVGTYMLEQFTLRVRNFR